MAWFILTSREFCLVLKLLQGDPQPEATSSTSSFCLLPAFSRWSSAIPIFQKLNEHRKGYMARKEGRELENLDLSRIFSATTYFSWVLSSAGAAQGSHLSTTESLTLKWVERQRFNLYRDPLELLLTGEEHRNNIEIMGRAYTLNLYYKNRDLRNLYSTENPSLLEPDFNFL